MGNPSAGRLGGTDVMSLSLQTEKGLSTEILALMADRQEVRGRFFLADQAQYHFGPENLLDVLNKGGKQFLPLAQDDVSEVVQIQWSRIAGLKPRQVACPDWPTPEDDPQCWQAAKISFAGTTLEGRAYLGDLHPDRRRITDLLNHCDPFFVFETDEGPWIINRNHLNLLAPLD
jgi:hypothetical protein